MSVFTEGLESDMDRIIRERDEAREMVKELREAAEAVIARWQSQNWEWSKQGPTGDLINALGSVVDKAKALP